MTNPLLESLTVLPRILTRLRRPTWRSLGCRTHGLCHACGAVDNVPADDYTWVAVCRKTGA